MKTNFELYKRKMGRIVFAFLFLICFVSGVEAKSGVNIFAYPRNVPEQVIFNRYGKSFKLNDFAGDFLIVVFWSKTCIPCLRELKDLNGFVNKTANDGIKLIMVSPEDEWVTATEQQTVLKRYNAENLDYYVDRKSKLASAFGIFTSPHAVLINKESMEIGRIRGSVDWDDDDVISYIYKIKAQN